MNRTLGRPSAAAAVIAPAVLAAAVYHQLPGLYFFADDFACLLQMVNDGFARFVIQPFGGHVLVLRNLVIYVCWRLFGLDAAPWGWVTLLTHAVNAGLLARVAMRVTSRPLLAAFTGVLWGTSPVNAGALGWYAVYGQVLGTTILLLLLDAVTANTGRVLTMSRALGWCALALAGATCFGTGIAVAIVLPAVALMLDPSIRRSPAARLLLALPLATVAMYAGLLWLAACVAPPSMDQAILFATFHQRPDATLVMFLRLVGFGITSTLLSFAAIDPAHPDTTTVLSVLAYVGVLSLGAVERRHRRTILAALLVAGAVYALVATGRAAIYANFGRDMALAATVSRYHYLAGVPLVLALCVALDAVADMPRAGRLVAPVLLAWATLMVVAWARSDWRLEQRDAQRQWVVTSLAAMDRAIDAAPPGTTVVLDNQPPPYELLGAVLPRVRFPGWVALFTLARPDDVVRGRRVRFVERDAAAWVEYRDLRGRVGSLLAGPDAAPTERAVP
jgi:hypothetical protein